MKRGILILLVIAAGLLAGNLLIYRKVQADKKDTKTTKIALIMDGSKNDQSLCQSQYEAMISYGEASGTEIVVRENVPPDRFFSNMVEYLIEEGCNIFFFTSYQYDPYLTKLAEAYPEICFLNANGLETMANLSSFNGRMYQMRYLMGLIAGFQSATGEIGYVVAEPVSETIRQVNAFTIGVRKTNPEAQVYVRYTNNWNDAKIAEDVTKDLLREHNIDILTLHLNTISPLEIADEQGVYTIGNNYDNARLFPRTYLTASIFDWEPFFAARISECERHKFVGRHYWEGIGNGLVTLSPLTGNVRFNARERVDVEMKKIAEGTYDVFYGPLKDNTGRLRVAQDENLTDDYLLYRMNWYVEGVVEEQ